MDRRPMSEAPRDGTVIIAESIGYYGVPETGHYAFERISWRTTSGMAGWQPIDKDHMHYGEGCFTGWWPDGTDTSKLPKTPRTNFKWRPSNGTEGEIFQEAWCERCVRDARGDCEILARTMIHDIGDEGYPEEWTEYEGKPACTAFDNGQPRRCEGTGELFP